MRKRKFGKGTAIFLPDYDDSTRGFQPLKGAAAEAAVIKKLSHGKIFRNRDATEDDFKSRAGSYRILHIASHTLLDLQNPFIILYGNDTRKTQRMTGFFIPMRSAR